MPAQTEIRVVLESEVYGRELYSFPDDEQAFAAMRRLLANSRSAFLNDGIERVIGIVVSNRQDWLSELH
jgi:hypothetical protein